MSTWPDNKIMKWKELVGFTQRGIYRVSQESTRRQRWQSPPLLSQRALLASISKATISKDLPEEHLNNLMIFLERGGISSHVPDDCNTEDFYSDLIRGILKPLTVLRGHVTCLVSEKPSVANNVGGFHGGAIAAVAEAVSIATARTIVAEDKELFLGELSISYLSAAPKNAEVIVDGFVLRSGRNLTVIASEFKLKKTGNVVYTARATFYHMPVAKL